VLKCDYRPHDYLNNAQAATLQKRRHPPSPATIVTPRRTVSDNGLPEELPGPEAEPRLLVSEPSLCVVNFGYIIFSLSSDEVLLLPLQSPATHHWFFDIRNR
jgi:hypothetical protein